MAAGLVTAAVQVLVCVKGVSLPLLQQFTAVLVEDGSTISLPSALASVWRGCGGSQARRPGQEKTEAALKVTVRLGTSRGPVRGPHLQAGRQHELRSVLQAEQMPRGSLWLADLGYWTLAWLRSLSQQGVYFLLRYKPGIVLWYEQQRLDLLEVLPRQVGKRLELLVEVGATKAIAECGCWPSRYRGGGHRAAGALPGVCAFPPEAAQPVGAGTDAVDADRDQRAGSPAQP